MGKFVITEKTPQPYRGAMRAVGDEIEIAGDARYEVSLGILKPAERKPSKGKTKAAEPVAPPEPVALPTEGDQEV